MKVDMPLNKETKSNQRNEFILSYLQLCLMLIYIRWTNANIGPWWVETQLNIFPASKYTNTHTHIYIYIWLVIDLGCFDMFKFGRSPCGVVANVLDCDNIASKFKLQSSYCIHFSTVTNRDWWQERVKGICSVDIHWWWWQTLINISKLIALYLITTERSPWGLMAKSAGLQSQSKWVQTHVMLLHSLSG